MRAIESSWRCEDYRRITSPLVVSRAGLLFSGVKHDRVHRLYCLALDDGGERWSIEINPESAVVDFALAVDGEGATAYLAEGSDLIAVTVDQGSELWAARVPDPLLQSFLGFGDYARPLVEGPQLLLTADDSRVVALDRSDGRLRWRTPGPSLPARVLRAQEGLVLSLSRDDNDVVAQELATGGLRWRFAMNGEGALSERLASSLVWAAAVPGVLPLLDGARALVGLDLAAGAARWQEPIEGLASYAVDPGGTTLLLSDEVTVRAIDPSRGQVRWRQPTGGMSWVAPLDRARALLHTPRGTATIEYDSGMSTYHFHHRIGEQDRLLDLAPGRAVFTFGESTRLFVSDGDRLVATEIGSHGARSTASPPYRAVIAGESVVVHSPGFALEAWR